MELTADRALFEGKIHGIVATFHENERPLQGLSGLLDWRFEGFISQCIKNGSMSGKLGECVYVPIRRSGDRLFHLILVGSGHSPSPGKRNPLPQEAVRPLCQNLIGLKHLLFGLSRADLGGMSEDAIKKLFKSAGSDLEFAVTA